jgi:hypothetical protein
MKLTKLHLIIILALTLILCPILGVCNNTREYFDQLQSTNEGFEEEEKEEGFAKEGEEEGFGNQIDEGFEGYQQNENEEGFDVEEQERSNYKEAMDKVRRGFTQEGMGSSYQQYQD